MYKLLLLLGYVIIYHLSIAQSPQIISIAKNCSLERLKKNLYYLASDEMEGRMTASHEDTITALFVAQQFKTAGLKAPYNGSYLQAVPILQQENKPVIIFGNNEYTIYDGWGLYPPSIEVDLQQCPVVYTAFTTKESLQSYSDTANLRGDIIVLQMELFYHYLQTGAADSLDKSLKAKGVMALLFVSQRLISYIEHFMKEPQLPVMKMADPAESWLPSPSDILPEISFTPKQMKRLLGADSSHLTGDSTNQTPFVLHNRLTLHSIPQFIQIQAPNIIGILPGSDTSLPCIVVSAHHDHEGHNGK